jgi:hypothetical protein
VAEQATHQARGRAPARWKASARAHREGADHGPRVERSSSVAASTILTIIVRQPGFAWLAERVVSFHAVTRFDLA